MIVIYFAYNVYFKIDWRDMLRKSILNSNFGNVFYPNS